jgi:hypothetical protein
VSRADWTKTNDAVNQSPCCQLVDAGEEDDEDLPSLMIGTCKTFFGTTKETCVRQLLPTYSFEGRHSGQWSFCLFAHWGGILAQRVEEAEQDMKTNTEVIWLGVSCTNEATDLQFLISKC